MIAKIRPATRADIEALIDEKLPYRIRAWAVERDDKVLGVGGFAFQPEGVIAAFVLKADGAEKYPLALHKAGRFAMKEAERSGYRRIVALAEAANPNAEPWLERLGFKLKMVDNVKTWIWEAA